MWTTPNTRKVRTDDRAPETTKSGIFVSAAKNEFEPFQLIIGPVKGSINVSMDNFSDLSSKQRIEIGLAEYESGWAEKLTPVSSDKDIELNDSAGTIIWTTIYVPSDAKAGDHESKLTITYNGKDIQIPVKLKVFNFELPKTTHFATQLNISIANLIKSGDAVVDAKNMLFEHRFTPKSVTWPSGFNWKITWENSKSLFPCSAFHDEYNEPDEYSIGKLAPFYILGKGWNDVGFPNAMIFQFVNNSTPRPDTFCGESRGDHYGSTVYNSRWMQYLEAVEKYLIDNKMIDKAYYYVQNEPQNDEDHKLAAYLSRLTKQAAPKLRIAISEEPKKEIAEHPDGACGYDIWIAHIRAYQQNYAWKRQKENNEQVWFYSLDHDPDPYFNPTKIENQGIHQRIIPWVSWHYRVTGWAYYDADRYFNGKYPGIRAELLREGIEDYEYLYLANSKAHPEIQKLNDVDDLVNSVAAGLTSWTKDPDALMKLRNELGLYLEGSRDSIPILESDSGVRNRGSYYINFQDPKGEPKNNPLIIDGKTYLKIGWQEYNSKDGYGWYGENVTKSSIVKYAYVNNDYANELQRSIVYDDYGRDNLFEFDLGNGKYRVTVGAGFPDKAYPNDPHNITIEGQKIVDEVILTKDKSLIEEEVIIDLKDGKLSLEMGGRSELNGNWSYTFLSYLKIEVVD